MIKPHIRAEFNIGNFGVEYWVFYVMIGRFSHAELKTNYTKQPEYQEIHPGKEIWVNRNSILIQKKETRWYSGGVEMTFDEVVKKVTDKF